MAEKDTVYSTKVKYRGVFAYKDLYAFCFDWLSSEVGLDLSEEVYSEKISGSSKEVDIVWKGKAKVTDYFAFEIKVEFKIIAMKDVEVNIGGKKIKSNEGDLGIKVKGVLVKDRDGKFETNAKMKIWRSIYEKFIISSRVTEYEDKLAGACDEFVSQTKAFLNLSAQR